MSETTKPITKGESVQREMRMLRDDLREDVADVVDSAQQLGDWRIYVRQYPWLCLGAAVAVGYMVVPQVTQIVSPDASTLAKLSKRNQLVVKKNPQPQARSSVANGLFSLATSMAMRGAMGYLGTQMGKILEPDSAANDSNTGPNS